LSKPLRCRHIVTMTPGDKTMTTAEQYHTTLRILEQCAADAGDHAALAKADARIATKVATISAENSVAADEAVIKADEKATDAAAAVVAYRDAIS
jgi:hypothetical protein